MSRQLSLKEAERKAFRTKYDDGLWDILLGCFFSMFAIAPFLSASLGDFWSSAVFVPFCRSEGWYCEIRPPPYEEADEILYYHACDK